MSDTALAPRDGREQRKSEAAKLVKLTPRGMIATATLHDQLVQADMLVKAGVLPQGVDTQAKAWALLAAGAEVGLGPMTACRWLYIQPKSRRVEWTAEGALAQARRSGLCKSIKGPWVEGEGDDMVAFFRVVRKDDPEPIVMKFSVADAKRAKLWHTKTAKGNDSNWTTWDREMLEATVKRRGIRQAVPECLGGLGIQGETQAERAEQLGDDEVEPAGDVVDVEHTPARPEPPAHDPLMDDEPPTPAAAAAPEPEDPADAFEAILKDAQAAAGDDADAYRDLALELERAHETGGPEAARKLLSEHPVFGGPRQGTLL